MRNELLAASMQPYATERVSTMSLHGYDPETLDETTLRITPAELISISYVREQAETAKSQLTARWKYDGETTPVINGIILYGRSNDVAVEPSDEMLIDRFDEVEVAYDVFTRTASLTAQRTGTSLTTFGKTKGDRAAFAQSLTTAETIAGEPHVKVGDLFPAAFDVNTAKAHYTLNLIYEDGIDGLPDELNDAYKQIGERLLPRRLATSYFDSGDFLESAIAAANDLLQDGKRYPSQTGSISELQPIFSFYDEELQETVDAVYQLDTYIDEYGNLFVGYFKIHEWYFGGGTSQKERDINRYSSIRDYPGEHATNTGLTYSGEYFSQLRTVKDTLYGEAYEIDYRGDINLMVDDTLGLYRGTWQIDPDTGEAIHDVGLINAVTVVIRRLNLDYNGGVLTGKMMLVPLTA